MKSIQEFLSNLAASNIKLSLEGNRLRFYVPEGISIPDTQLHQLRERKAEIINFLQNSQLESIPKRPQNDEPLSLSWAQERLWFLDQLEGESATYNMRGAFRIKGNLDINALEKALSEIVRRHETLRTSFQKDNGKPIQVIEPDATIKINLVDLQQLEPKEQENLVVEKAQLEATTPFDLENAPLIRCSLLQLSTSEYVLLITMHHIVSDGWSIGVFAQELSSLYRAFIQGEASPLADLPIQYADFAVWQKEYLSGEVLSTQLNYWKQQLSDAPDLLQLPTDYPRPTVQTYQGRSISFSLNTDLTTKLQTLAQESGTTLFMTLYAAFSTLLYRYSGQSDILIGSPIANRNRREIESLIGFLVNNLVLRTNFANNPSFKELLAQVRETTLKAYEHQDVPFEQIVEALQPQRSLSHSPLFQVMFILQNTPMEELALPGVTLNPIELESTMARFDLTLSMTKTEQGLVGKWEYNTDLFEGETIEGMAAHFHNLLEAILENPAQKIGSFNLLSESERHQLLFEWNDTATEYAKDKCIHFLFEEQVEKTPDAVAVVFEDEQLTYKQLNQRANQLAHHLQSLGVKPEVLVGICVERSVEMIVGLLGILKAGGAYVPLDPNYPPERLSYMLRDSGTSILLTQSTLTATAPQQLQIFCLDTDGQNLEVYSSENPPSQVTSSNLAYVIYTSGSTGKPKGVTIEHRQVSNFFTGIDHRIGSNNPGTWLALTTICFDISVLELFWTLSRGFQVIIAAEQKKIFSSTTSQSKIVEKDIDFSLFYFASDGRGNDRQDKYKLLMEGAKFADSHGFSAVWTPERHFHEFGGLYPNPSVVSAAIAALTKNISIRAGSVVLPLHDEIRVAEEWSVVDNLSQGRVGISFASGWQPNDFVLAPENYQQRKAVMVEKIETVRKLWRGESIGRVDGNGKEIEIKILPPPLQKELPIWITAAGNPETFKSAGELGLNLLTHLLGQTIEELGEKIKLYRQAWRDSGHDGNGHVTIMVHTFIGDDLEAVRQKVYQPLSNYLRSSLGLMKNMAISMNQDPDKLTPEDWDVVVDHAFNRYFDTSGLLGNKEKCLGIINQLKAIDIDEVGCLIDFGVDVDEVIASLNHLNAVKEDSKQKHLSPSHVSSISELIAKHNVSHLQCTPSLLKILPNGTKSFKSLQKVLVGGEKLPISLAQELGQVVSGKIYNMYGPTEATIWSTVAEVQNTDAKISIGNAIANTQIYILDQHLQPLPVGVPGELYIGGDGLARGYFNRPELTAERFIQNPFDKSKSQRLYKTGDLARYIRDGNIEILGRIDNQVKIRGFRIELGEIEAVLTSHSQVNQAVVIAQAENTGSKSLIAYIVVNEKITTQQLREYIKEKLPGYMVPSVFVTLESLPITPNGKINPKALPAPDGEIGREDEYVAPRTEVEQTLTNIWAEFLPVTKISIHDNFFDLGGNSLSVVQIVSRIREAFEVDIPIKNLFEEPTIINLAKIIENSDSRILQKLRNQLGNTPAEKSGNRKQIKL